MLNNLAVAYNDLTNKMNIEINTNENHRTADLLDFYTVSVSVSPDDGWVKVIYENLDQIPSICRIFIDNNIEILSISLDRSEPGIIPPNNDMI